ncbi:MAG: CPBP family intramembrane metalloprotease [Bacteroidetes bacterium]|nr:MAG: CPBP family intramembrane metalloprotease [Bacteroidota bacterium]
MENNQEQPEFGMEQLRDHWLYRLLQVIVLIMTGMFGAVVMQMLASWLSTVIWSLEWENLLNSELLKSDMRYVHASQLIQAFSAIGAFIFPVMYMAMRDQEPFWEYAGLKKKPKLKNIGFAVLAAVLAIPGINALADLFYGITWPEAYQEIEKSLRETQEHVLELQSLLMRGDSILDLIVQSLIVAVIPAVSEELFFRRALPKQLFNLSRNAHVSVWVSAVLFGLVHFSAYNLLSIILMGAVFGYLVLWTGNIWIPIIAHFTNNFISLVLFKLEQSEDVTTESYPYWIIGLSILALMGLLWYLHRQYQGAQDE